jgi:hypothetical protein
MTVIFRENYIRPTVIPPRPSPKAVVSSTVSWQLCHTDTLRILR